ncbi:MAG: hypothetical protein ACRDN0_35855 [Trebonia sp.]
MAKSLGPGDITVHRNDGIAAPDGNFWDNGQDVDDNDWFNPGGGDGDDFF